MDEKQGGPAGVDPVESPTDTIARILSRVGVRPDPGEPAPQVDVERALLIAELSAYDLKNFFEKLDAATDTMAATDAATVLLAAAGFMVRRGDSVQAADLLADAADLIPLQARHLHLISADLYLRLGKPDLALDHLLLDAMDDADGLSPPARAMLLRKLRPTGYPKQTGAEHGHSLLIDYLEAHAPKKLSRRRTMIEIGTTREHIQEQGSTRKLALLCASLEVDFITVDMDPRNSRRAQRMFDAAQLPFQAITAKGEDFLAHFEGEIDYVFLDAYDFDHGQHSELRQSRYEAFLGSRIDDAQCHQMHLDCAQSLAQKLAADGLICFDDTWTDAAGAWTAKGTTAMPYLLDHGFEVVVGRNRAALLARAQGSVPSAGRT